MPRPLLLLFLKPYILPTFNYCDIVCSPKQEAHHLETLLDYSCRTVLHKNRDYSASAHRQLGMSTLAARRKFHTAQMVFKCLFSKALPYLSQLFASSTSHHHTHSASSSHFNLPPVKTSPGQRSFSFLCISCNDVSKAIVKAVGRVLSSFSASKKIANV